jgi:hypothetical protein
VLGSGHADLLGSFLQAKKLSGIEPRYDLRADVAGDARPERIVIVDRYVVVYGPGYKRGETYGYFALPYGLGGGLKSAALVDLTGDGRAELTVTVRQRNELGARELWLVLSLDEAGIAPSFAVELRKELAGGFIESSLSVVPAAKQAALRVPRIEVKRGRAEGLDASSYREASAVDAQPILLPWGEIEARSYAFDGTTFARLAEKKAAASKRPAPPAANAKAPRAEGGRGEPPPPAGSRPSVPLGAADLLALFKSQHNLAASAKPIRTLRANVLFGAAEEQIDMFGSVLVFTGPEVGEGRGYLTYALPASEPRDLLELRAADVTGEGCDELLLRMRQPLLGAEGAERELLLVLRGAAGGRLTRALLVEVARRQGPHAIENRVRVERGALAIEPGVAKAWSKASYPFTPEAVSGAQRLLLPWSDRPVRYRYAGGLLVAAY